MGGGGGVGGGVGASVGLRTEIKKNLAQYKLFHLRKTLDYVLYYHRKIHIFSH